MMEMNAKKRIKLEKLLRMHGKKNKALPQALNIINLDLSCCLSLRNHSNTLYSLISSLEEKTTVIKRTFDKLGLIDYSSKSHTAHSSYNRVLEDIPEKLVYNTPMEVKYHRNKENHFKRDHYVKLVKLMNSEMDFIIKGNDLLNCYVKHQTRNGNLEKLKISNNAEQADTQLKSFLRVCTFFPPEFEISSTDSKSLNLYLKFYEFLKYCYEVDLQDSEIVMRIFIILLKMHCLNSGVHSTDGQPSFSKRILMYILFHTAKTKTNLQFYMSNYFKTISYSQSFSVLETVVKGDKKKVIELLRSGFDIFPAKEQEEIGHKFPDISETLPKDHKMILFAMEKIKSNSLWSENGIIAINEKQKECFRIICRYIMSSYVSKRELYNSISAWYEHVLSNRVNENWCRDKKRRLTRLVKLYADNFPDMAAEVKEPSLLEDLCKISLRNSFRNVHKHSTPVPPIVLDDYRVFNVFEDLSFTLFEN